MLCPYCLGEQHRPVGLVADEQPDPIARAVDGTFVICRNCAAMFEVPARLRACAYGAGDEHWDDAVPEAPEALQAEQEREQRRIWNALHRVVAISWTLGAGR